ncbi:HI0074 family nucleotidyltransferase substrate-binding subunit [Methanolapillus millepedarum]|uniref:Nucleotidyltransferase n=1 Tax=Methanolapillus millepedarum TaxID=3028296 RepID=A0AA96V2P1_9EURY|nr:hypothetical protein MsAc7_04420 [Methanosarcinaceae archaeon Ac7]
MVLDLTSLKNGINALKETIQGEKEAKEITSNKRILNGLRAGVIQDFELSYELCFRFMNRWMKENVNPDFVNNSLSRREFYKWCSTYGLIDNVSAWMEFHEARNSSTHTYDEKIADQVFQAALSFLPYAEKLLITLEQHND